MSVRNTRLTRHDSVRTTIPFVHPFVPRGSFSNIVASLILDFELSRVFNAVTNYFAPS